MTDDQLDEILRRWRRNKPADVAYVWQFVDALVAEAKQLREGMRAIIKKEHDCCPDTMGGCSCHWLMSEIAKDALKDSPDDSSS